MLNGLLVADLGLLFNEIVRLEIELWNGVDARLQAELDMPLGRFEPMRKVAAPGRCRVFDLADDLGITVGGASKIVDRLEASGHCRRTANPDDKRSSIIELTAAGQRVLSEGNAAFNDELQLRLGAVLPERVLQQLTTNLTKLRVAGQQLTAGRKAA